MLRKKKKLPQLPDRKPDLKGTHLINLNSFGESLSGKF